MTTGRPDYGGEGGRRVVTIAAHRPVVSVLARPSLTCSAGVRAPHDPVQVEVLERQPQQRRHRLLGVAFALPFRVQHDAHLTLPVLDAGPCQIYVADDPVGAPGLGDEDEDITLLRETVHLPALFDHGTGILAALAGPVGKPQDLRHGSNLVASGPRPAWRRSCDLVSHWLTAARYAR
jgi:hypothetical protein